MREYTCNQVLQWICACCLTDKYDEEEKNKCTLIIITIIINMHGEMGFCFLPRFLLFCCCCHRRRQVICISFHYLALFRMIKTYVRFFDMNLFYRLYNTAYNILIECVSTIIKQHGNVCYVRILYIHCNSYNDGWQWKLIPVAIDSNFTMFFGCCFFACVSEKAASFWRLENFLDVLLIIKMVSQNIPCRI